MQSLVWKSPPDLRIEVLDLDPELIEPIPGRNPADSLEVFDRVLGDTDDVPQRVSLHPGISSRNRKPAALTDGAHLAEAERDRPRLGLIELQSFRELGEDLGNDFPLR